MDGYEWREAERLKLFLHRRKRRYADNQRDFAYLSAYCRETRSLFAPPVSRAGKTEPYRLQRVYRSHD